jgi:hypothetical protein
MSYNGNASQRFPIFLQFVKKKLIPYVKDEGDNLLTLAQILPSIINYIFMAFLVFW